MKPHVVHRTSNRMRIRLADAAPLKNKQFIEDLRLSPGVANVQVRGLNLIIEHADDKHTMTELGQSLSKIFPGFEGWSDDFDSRIAKAAADPWINKLVPLSFLGLAVYTGVTTGAILAGESAFALSYVAFDLYWKFQQENVIRKIEKGLPDAQEPKAR